VLSLWILIAFASEPAFRFSALNSEEVIIRPLLNISSPTGLMWHDGDLYLCADLMAPRPGIYRLIREKDKPWRAVLVQDLPQQELQGLTMDARGRIFAASSRFFSHSEEDWKNQVLILDPDRRRILDRTVLPMGNLCGSGTPECGLIGVVPTADPDRLLAVTRKALARLYVLSRPNARSAWTIARDLPLWGEKTMPTVTEVQADDTHLYFLLQQRREIARVPRAALAEERRDRLELETVFSFSRVSERLPLRNTSLTYQGCAEGFTTDDRGRLYILLNNRGFAWRDPPDGVSEPYPKLLIFEPEADR